MPPQRYILILEDNAERIAAFQEAVQTLDGGWSLKIWRDAPTMIAECAAFLPSTCLISLDHDLNAQPGASCDPGTGVDVAEYLSLFPRVCPVILHSTNHERVYSMHNELRFAGWHAERICPIGNDWISKSWKTKVTEYLREPECRFEDRRSEKHETRMNRALTSLLGLAIGDGIGEMFFTQPFTAPDRITRRALISGPWFHTDDTEMALSIFETLEHHGFLQQDSLSRRFARRYDREPLRGYGSKMILQLMQVLAGEPWQLAATSVFQGEGSMGNGSAMRVAPLGAYFADDLEAVGREAALSSQVTHTHPEGVAGAIAIAIAAAVAAENPCPSREAFRERMFAAALNFTPPSKVRSGIELARSIPLEADPMAVGRTLGNGSLITAPDTVPYALWCAARHIDDSPMALATSICTGGDCDTNAAIVGGIVACAVGREGIPKEWQTEMEPLKFL